MEDHDRWMLVKAAAATIAFPFSIAFGLYVFNRLVG
jgi:hypothetical protein